MIKFSIKIIHVYSCIIEFIKPVEEEIKCETKHVIFFLHDFSESRSSNGFTLSFCLSVRPQLFSGA